MYTSSFEVNCTMSFISTVAEWETTSTTVKTLNIKISEDLPWQVLTKLEMFKGLEELTVEAVRMKGLELTFLDSIAALPLKIRMRHW